VASPSSCRLIERCRSRSDPHLPEENQKNARARNAWIVFQDESGFSLLPSVRATWAPKGHTPVLTHHFNWKRLSMSAALCFRPDGSAASLVFGIQPGAYNDESLMEFLTELHCRLDGDKVALIWDRLPSHRGPDHANLPQEAGEVTGRK